MKYIKKFQINEKMSKFEQGKKQLKYFQNAMELDVTIEELMDSIEAIKADLNSIFPTLKGNEKMSELTKDEKFVDTLNKLELKVSDLYETEDLDTFARLPLKWYWIHNEDSNEMDIPIYILYKYFHDGKWSPLQLYYVQDDINNFLDELALVTIEIKVKDDDGNTKSWIYTTPDSGKTWKLKEGDTTVDDGKKIVKSSKPTSTFKPTMAWDDILYLARNVKTELVIY